MAVRNWKSAKFSWEIKTQGGPGTAASDFNKQRRFQQLIFQSASKFIPCSASCTSPNLPPNALNCLTRPSPAEIRLPAHQYTHFYTLPLAIQSCLVFPKEKRASSAPTDTPGMCVGQHCTANSFFLQITAQSRNTAREWLFLPGIAIFSSWNLFGSCIPIFRKKSIFDNRKDKIAVFPDADPSMKR